MNEEKQNRPIVTGKPDNKVIADAIESIFYDSLRFEFVDDCAIEDIDYELFDVSDFNKTV